MTSKLQSSVVRQYVAMILLLASVGCISGCADQKALTAGAKYAEAYSKVGALVNETFVMSENARVRTQIAEFAKLPRPQATEGLAVDLACAKVDDSTAKAMYVSGNLSRYQNAIEGLAKATDKTMGSIVAGLRKSLPTKEKIVKSFEDFEKAETLRVDNCRRFAKDALAQDQPFATSASGAEVTAVLELIKAFLSAYETERRAEAYKKLVIQLDEPVRQNLLALNEEVQKLLKKAAAEGLTSAARELSLLDENVKPPRFYGSTNLTADALARFKRAYAILDVIYLSQEGDETAFTALIKAHDAIVQAAKNGDVDGAGAIDDLLTLLAFVKDVEEKLAAL